MESLFTSYLLQSKECVLPGIGSFQIKYLPATYVEGANQLLPPSEEIIFKEEILIQSPGIVKYIADKKHIEENEAEALLSNFCNEWNKKIRAGDKLNLLPIGSLHSNEDGEILFKRETGFRFLQPITLKNLYQKTEEPELNREAAVLIDNEPELINKEEVLIGEETEESHGKVMQEDVVIKKSYWGYWAFILFTIGVVVIFLHFKDHNFSSSSTGNTNKFMIDSAGATYQLPK
jgi:nucleoid DNA-binding protein